MNVRSGTKVTIDGFEGKVWRKSGDSALIAWYTAEPTVIRTASGREISAWTSEQSKLEWVSLDSDRLVRS
jgi:hypothetical protein